MPWTLKLKQFRNWLDNFNMLKAGKVKKNILHSILGHALVMCCLLACRSPYSTPAPILPTPLSQTDLQMVVVQTANAAQNQTASALPSITNTPTKTRLPSITPSFTPTFIFLLPTATPVPSYTPILPPGIIIVKGTITNGTTTVDERLTSKPWSCLVLGSTPPRNVPQNPGEEFYVTWTVMNTGTETWPSTGVDFIYESGYRTEQRQFQDLGYSVTTGSSIDLKVLLEAPERPDTYNVIWALRVGHRTFCHMRIVFLVK
jgi:hypothetical protein